MVEGMEVFNTRLLEMERRTVVLEGERQQVIIEVTVLRGQVGQRQPAAAGVPASATPTFGTKVIGKLNHCSGDSTRIGDWSFKLKQLFAEAEQSAVPTLNATRDSTDATLSVQLYHVLVVLSTDTALDKYHNAGINDGLATLRQYTVEWEPKILSC